MSIFNIGIKILIGAAAIYFLIFSYICYGWSSMHSKKERAIIAIFIPLLSLSLILPIGLIVVGLIALIFEYF
jgi:TRAP-type C4-dicarboxylate transport system permease small subunit